METKGRMIRATAGIVGLPNVGKSALFNALTQTQLAQSSNFPFCTIEPNVAKVVVPDPALDRLSKLVSSQRTIYQNLELYDIAGLIKNANEGAGLGNQFLGNIRNVSMIIHLVRCFTDENIIHVDGDSFNPVQDMEVINTELLLADIQSIEKRLQKRKRPKEELDILEMVQQLLSEGKPARIALNELSLDKVKSELAITKELKQQLLTCKNVLHVCNVDEMSVPNGNELSQSVREELAKNNEPEPVVVSARLEEEAFTLFETEEERREYLLEFGLEESSLSKIAKHATKLLDLDHYYTIGVQEARAWSINKGSTAQESAGKIHTDMARGFIAAETVSYDDFLQSGGWKGAKENGKVRMEGREYIVQTGDVMNFKFNV